MGSPYPRLGRWPLPKIIPEETPFLWRMSWCFCKLGRLPPNCEQNKIRRVANQSLVTPVGRPHFRPTAKETSVLQYSSDLSHGKADRPVRYVHSHPPYCGVFPSPHHAWCSPGVRRFAKVRRTYPKTHHALSREDSCSSSRMKSLASPVRASYVFGIMIREPATGLHNFSLIISAISRKDTILRP